MLKPKQNKKMVVIMLVFLLAVIIFASLTKRVGKEVEGIEKTEKISLPKEFIKGNLTVFDSIKTRRSIREYSEKPITLKELSTLLFATQGITSTNGWEKRAAPSAGALYPMETYIVVNNVDGLDKGLYHYIPDEHALEIIKLGDFGKDIRSIGLGQAPLEEAAVDFIWTAVFERTTKKYGERGIRYIHIEAGHISENLYLQANSMGIGVVAIGAFNDDAINKFLGVDGEKESVIYINAVGKKQ